MKILGWTLIVLGVVGGGGNLFYSISNNYGMVDIISYVVVIILFSLVGLKLISKAKQKSSNCKNIETDTVKDTKTETVKNYPFNPYVNDEEIRSTGELTIIDYPGLIKKKDEVVHYATPAELYDSKERIAPNFYSGDLVVTNLRVIFINKDKPFDIPLNKITAIVPIASDAFSIVYGSKSQSIIVGEEKIELVANILISVTETYNE